MARFESSGSQYAEGDSLKVTRTFGYSVWDMGDIRMVVVEDVNSSLDARSTSICASIKLGVSICDDGCPFEHIGADSSESCIIYIPK